MEYSSLLKLRRYYKYRIYKTIKVAYQIGFFLFVVITQVNARTKTAYTDTSAQAATYALQPQIRIRGKVTDSANNPLSGVSVIVQDTRKGTFTDQNGEYSIEANRGAVLEFSHVGYVSKKIEAGGDVLNVVLTARNNSLNDVVVVGYGTEKKGNLTGAVSTVPISELKQSPVTNLSNSLAGKIPGVIAINGSGEPGSSGSTILIRGNHSLNNNAPLIVIDGIPYPNTALGTLDVNDIESMSVLKDATASIYGAESANGVILITTKHGTINMKPEVRLNLNQGFNQPARVPKMADAPTYMTMLNEAALYNGRDPAFTQQDIDAYKSPDRDLWLYPNTDWFKATLKPLSPQTNGNLSIQGGSAGLTYFLSIGAKTEDGYYKNSATRYNQFNVRSNITDQVTRNIKIGLDINGRKEDRHYPLISAVDNFRMIMRGRPTDPAYYPNGLPGPDQEGGVQPVVTGTTQTGIDRNQQYYITGNLSMDITIPGLKGFNLHGLLSYNKEFEEVKHWEIPWTLYAFDKSSYINNGEKDPEKFLTPELRGPSDPELTQTYYQQEKTLGQIIANYKHSFGEHNLTFMAGSEMQKFNDNTFNAFRRHFISTSIPELFAGGKADWTNNGSAEHGARLSYFDRIDYNYKEKYLFQFVSRIDGSYLFPSNKRYGFFPAFSGGWRISQEPFFRDHIKLFDDLKLRASWGRTGNDITDPNALVEAQQYLNGFVFGSGYVLGGDNVVQSLAPSVVANPYITWERARQIDFGVDGTLLNHQLDFTVDYWNQLRSGILIQPSASVPASTGLNLPKENLGIVRSWGYDGIISWNKTVNNAFSYHLSLNGGYSTTKIVFWDEIPNVPSYQISTGKKISTGLYYKTDGVYQNQQQVDASTHMDGARPGDLIFEDVNKDGKIDANDEVRINKNTTPDWTGGLTLGATWKQISLTVFFQGAAGAVRWVSTESGDIGNYLEDFAKNRWRPDPNDKTGMTPDPSGAPYSGPRTFDRGDTYWSPQGSNASTYFLRNTDYVRLKTLELGYNLPHKLLAKLGGIDNFRIYVNGYNLITWDKFKLMDPEASNSAGDYYPQERIYNFGLNITF